MEPREYKIICGLDGRKKILLGFPGGSDGKEVACNAETGVPSLGWENPLKKEGMAIRSSILAWRIPWTEEPVGQATVMGLQRVGHD